MRPGNLLVFLSVMIALIPVFYIYRALQRTIRPRESAGRFFLFIFANFLLVVVYTITVVAVWVKLFPIR